MSTPEHDHWPPVAESALQQGAQASGHAASDPDYRELERCYRQSLAYAAMVERYPLLRSAIASCRGIALVGRPSAPPRADVPGVRLHWQRSHGEG
ncbi:MAG: hypothetical protein ACKO8I_09870 [Cyanobacteriota bacterium]